MSSKMPHQKHQKSSSPTSKSLIDLQSRPFAPPQPAFQSEPPNLQTQLETAQRFGHHLANIPLTSSIQTKLTLGKVGDKYEQEADQVAHQVVQRLQNTEMPAISPPLLSRKPSLQRQAERAGSISPDIENSINQAKADGQPLAGPFQQKLEGAMGADFSQVRVHTNAQSDQLNRSLSARAFTTGHHIFFKQGEYNPNSRQGQELIAHEATHVLQQNPNVLQRQPASTPQPQPLLPIQLSTTPNIIQRDVLLDPGVPATVKKNTPVYKEEAVKKEPKKAKEHQIGKLTQDQKGLSHDTEYPSWVKFKFEEDKDKQWVGTQVALDNSQKIGEGFIPRSNVSLNKWGSLSLSGHGKQKNDPLFHQDKDGNNIVSPDDVHQGFIGDCMLMAALMEIAQQNPKHILNMITDNGQTVSVRLYKEQKPETVTVRKTVLKKTKIYSLGSALSKHRTSKQNRRLGAHGPVLWPAMIEKAFAKLAGSYREINPGRLDPYEVLTGLEVKREKLFQGFDIETGVKSKGKLDDPKFAKDFDKWKDFVENKLNDFIDEIQAWDAHLGNFEFILKKAGVSKAFRKAVLEEYGDYFDKGVMTGDYTKGTLAGFEKIKAIIDRGEYIETGTKDWRLGQRGGGHSGGEDTSKVKGLVAPHAYAIIGYRTEKKGKKEIHFLRIRNPWGFHGMKYDSKGQRQKTDEPEFEIDLSDARRFFGESTGWRYTETPAKKVLETAKSRLDKSQPLSSELINNLKYHQEKLKIKKQDLIQSNKSLVQANDKAAKTIKENTEKIEKLGEEMKKLFDEKNDKLGEKKYQEASQLEQKNDVLHQKIVDQNTEIFNQNAQIKEIKDNLKEIQRLLDSSNAPQQVSNLKEELLILIEDNSSEEK
jgi:hypothetical protein